MAELLKQHNPALRIGMVGAKVAVDPEGTLRASSAIDFVAREEFDYTCKEVAEGRELAEVAGLSYRDQAGELHHNPPRAALMDMDELPWVAPVYRRDLRIENYFIGYLKHPYVSFYTGRGCRSKCTFCLWPQTVGGHRYRVRSVDNVLGEVQWIKENLPQVKEIFFDDDTFTDFRPRAEQIARGLGRLGVTWSCNAKANVPYDTLRVMKDNGLRLLLVGYESGNDQILHNIRKGLRTDIARRFTRDCRRLGIIIHGTFILGLPGETEQTMRDTVQFAIDINPHTIQVSLAAPYPGTELYAQAIANGWLQPDASLNLVNNQGVQLAPISYPHLSAKDIYHGVETFYRRFYFRPRKIAELTGEMITSWEMTKRRLREGVEFFRFLRAHTA
jgi:hopanoid biosynthesis associated radical SAM protein HpnJ